MSGGWITDVQRFSLHDGPGIRTTVFMKGCNLCCAWCHNPETWSPGPELFSDASRCVGCAACVSGCPRGALRLTAGKVSVDRHLCGACGLCARACSFGCLAMTGTLWTEDRLVEMLLRDRALYGAEGGATFSGGEPLLQAEFLSRVAARLKDVGVSVALDTAGCVPWNAFESVLPQINVVLYDIKTVDPALHRRWTGHDNSLILENLERLSALGTHRLFIRHPLIGDVNDSPAESDAFLALARRLRVERVDLLIWHDYGNAKARALGRAVRQFEKPDAHQVQRMLHELAGAGIPAQIVS